MIIPASKADRRIVKAERLELELGIDHCTAELLADRTTAIIEKYCGCTFALETVLERIPGHGTVNLRLSRKPIVEIIEFSDFVENTDYYIDHEKGWLVKISGFWQEAMSSIRVIDLIPVARATNNPNYEITYKAGYAPNDMPADLQAVCIELCRSLGDPVNRSYSSQSIGDWSYSLGESITSGIKEQLNQYKVIA